MKQIYLKKYTKNEHKNSDLSDPAIFCLPHVKNLHNNDLFLTTTAVDLRSRLDFFSANLKQRGVRLLKSEVKKNIVYVRHTHKSEQQDSVDQEIETEIKFF